MTGVNGLGLNALLMGPQPKIPKRLLEIDVSKINSIIRDAQIKA